MSPQLADDLLRDFELYKRYGRKPDYFGRDCRYDRPESIISSEIYHIHLDLVSPVPFNGQRVQFRQVSDTALVYTRGFFNEDAYSILAVLEPAHTMLQPETMHSCVPSSTMRTPSATRTDIC
ncbi:type II toxin-antitoxin system YafO family toxin [Pantoea rodasii]|uniref:type II toxin-antitoxin system YafO family toxin n=1 Tax=Pantoea rodasii TaxID=1076549 RepID=UPI001301D2F5